MTDDEYQKYYESLPAWYRRTLLTLAIAPFVGALVMIVLGMAGVIQ